MGLSTLGIFLVVCASSVLFVQHAAFSDACSATLDATLTGTYIGGAVAGYMALQTIVLDVVDANAAPIEGSDAATAVAGVEEPSVGDDGFGNAAKTPEHSRSGSSNGGAGGDGGYQDLSAGGD